jgi:hypothetical protein
LFLIPRAEIRLQNQRWLIVNNNEFATARKFRVQRQRRASKATPAGIALRLTNLTAEFAVASAVRAEEFLHIMTSPPAGPTNYVLPAAAQKEPFRMGI